MRRSFFVFTIIVAVLDSSPGMASCISAILGLLNSHDRQLSYLKGDPQKIILHPGIKETDQTLRDHLNWAKKKAGAEKSQLFDEWFNRYLELDTVPDMFPDIVKALTNLNDYGFNKLKSIAFGGSDLIQILLQTSVRAAGAEVNALYPPAFHDDSDELNADSFLLGMGLDIGGETYDVNGEVNNDFRFVVTNTIADKFILDGNPLIMVPIKTSILAIVGTDRKARLYFRTQREADLFVRSQLLTMPGFNPIETDPKLLGLGTMHDDAKNWHNKVGENHLDQKLRYTLIVYSRLLYLDARFRFVPAAREMIGNWIAKVKGNKDNVNAWQDIVNWLNDKAKEQFAFPGDKNTDQTKEQFIRWALSILEG